MNDLQKATPLAGEPSGAGGLFGAGAQHQATVTGPILRAGARSVKPLSDQAARLEAHHRALAGWHRERAARWLEWAHLSPWHAAHWREHLDAAAWHDTLAARHAQIGASLEEVDHD